MAFSNSMHGVYPSFRSNNTLPFQSLPEYECPSDGFDRLPDHIILIIFNNISDIKTLIRCRSVSGRFNSLVPQSDSLLLRVDRVISAVDSYEYGDTSSVIGLIKSIVKSIHDFISPTTTVQNPKHQHQSQNSPAMILRGFDRIKRLEIELPTGNLRLEKRAGIKWKAEFGKSLNSCVILGFRCGGVGESELGGGGGLKTRVVWTISALIAASARHYMVKEIVKKNIDLSKLVVKDKENEGIVILNESGIKEFRDAYDVDDIDDGKGEINNEDEGQTGNLHNDGGGGGGGVWWRSNRTRVPAVWMRMRHESKLELSNGVVMEGATLVIVRPTMNANGVVGSNSNADESIVEEQRWDERLVASGNGFEGVYGEAVVKLIKRRSYLLEMNSF
ncbi:F-box protein AUF2-like [Rutidosis leptorrhynchoides]|uniref:F-box protein AUF2-like n=1 Tax=Rutidosis leptorrhynchoides TaxID=125765 RepID=UPI003A9A05F7